MLERTMIVASLRRISDDYREVVEILYSPAAQRRQQHLRNLVWLDRLIGQLETGVTEEGMADAAPRQGKQGGPT